MKRTALATVVLSILAVASILPGTAGAQEEQPELDCNNAMSQSDMNQCAYMDYQDADEELNAVWKKAKAYMVEQDRQLKEMSPELVGAVDALMKAQRAWIEYRDGQCEAYGFQSRGGTMEPMLVDGCKAGMTKARTKELKELYEGAN